ncbi:MAG: hypothetical protein AAGA62_02000 [Bacteroidota bacterium]
MALIFLISSVLMVVLSAITSKGGGYKPSSDTPANIVSDFKLRNGLSIAIIATGVATAVRLLLQPVPGVPAWAVFLFAGLSVAVLALIYTDKQEDDHKAIDLEPSLFRTRMSFNIATIAVILILAVIYGFLA